ncbi:cytochrome c family protein [Labilithrix luteola]|uniref:Cytochrome c family protein n=2 Tax=Labilithrix luteola TaxID=1391654 RepID=A0A0K1QBA7_9BACT|nr:cytochrome c family protein [Labilithrix luteola]
MRGWSSAALPVVVAATIVAACSSSDEAPAPTLTGQALLDPNNCLPCHADQFREWSGSMHAYAGEDPVFTAMNKRMQRETNGQAGDFCVACHAPVAVRLGLTKDGLNLAELPAYARGVTCYFCHSTDAVEGTHNNPLHLATDDTLRGGFDRPMKGTPHKASYSTLHDREQRDSARLCGACHDVVTPEGAHIERTFTEWEGSLYSKPGQLPCGKCHMDGRSGFAANVDGAPQRRVHDHSMAAVDVALTPFTQMEAQRAAVQQLLDATLLGKLCVKQSPTGILAEVTLDNAFAGHNFPSGASQDRRAWVEIVAYREGAVVFSSGVAEEKKPITALADPNLWLLRDKIFGKDGAEVHMFWQAASVESNQLTASVTTDPTDPAFYHSVTRTYPLPSPAPDRVTMRARMRPVDFDLLDDLVATGDLDAAILDKIPTFDLASTVKEWTRDGGFRCVE